MNKLLEKAKSYKTPSRRGLDITEELIELALEWVNGNISNTQVGAALGRIGGMTSYTALARALRDGVQKGTLKIEKIN